MGMNRGARWTNFAGFIGQQFTTSSADTVIHTTERKIIRKIFLLNGFCDLGRKVRVCFTAPDRVEIEDFAVFFRMFYGVSSRTNGNTNTPRVLAGVCLTFL